MRKFKNTPKKVYKKAKPQQLPRNYRFIPEKLSGDSLGFFIGTVCILAAILIVSLDLSSNYKEGKKIISEKGKVLNEVAFWQNEVKIHPDYRDGYFSLALLEFQLRNLSETRSNIDKALNLDPNFKEGRDLQKQLE